MKVVVREMGKRPTVATSARLNAPQGAKALADLLAEETFADLCIISVDWEGDGFTPALIIDTAGWYKDWPGQPLTHHWPIDLEEAFGLDNMDNGILRSIVMQLKEHFEGRVEHRRRTGNLHGE